MTHHRMDSGTSDISDAALQALSHGQLKEITITIGMGRGRPRGTKEDTLRRICARRDQPGTAIEPVSREIHEHNCTATVDLSTV